MQFLISDTFTDSLARLNNDEQKSAKMSAFELQMNPASPGLKFHKVDKSKDPNFWSIRGTRDIRIIVHKTNDSILLCYVDHHDNAYRWAERRRLETHPQTGAAQIVEVRETVKEITVPVYVPEEVQPEPKPPIFANIAREDLLKYGVPADWIEDVLKATEDSILELADSLPSEAAEALLDLATGTTPTVTPVPTGGTKPFDHPDAQRRFRVITNIEELERAFEYPWDKWTVFLHPSQREMVERDYNGPARVSGSAGTGKTIVALHRAVNLTRNNPDARVLLTTFSDPLANALKSKLKRLIHNEPKIAERLEVYSMNAVGLRLYESNFQRPNIVLREQIQDILKEASAHAEEHKFSMHFLITEWEQVVDAWQLNYWDDYRDVARLGRKTRLPEKQRVILWSIFEQVLSKLKEQGLTTYAQIFSALALKLQEKNNPSYDYIVVDEAQDISVPQLKFLSSLGDDRPNSLFFAGDLGQRIFQQPFSWKSLGVDIRGRSKTLKVNYRTSHQIRRKADLLLEPEISDVDENTEERKGTVSIFNGPDPVITVYDSQEDEVGAVATWIKKCIENGMTPSEIGVFVRSDGEIDRARNAVDATGVQYKVLDENFETITGYISVSTMHLAKGLEFRAVVVMACDDEVLPLQERIETVADNSDLQEVYDTERHLLYVACTRARDQLFVSGVDPASEFLDDLDVKR